MKHRFWYALSLASAAIMLAAVAHVQATPVVSSDTQTHRTDPPARAPIDMGALLNTHSAAGSVAVRNWKALRDARIVKQDLDDSCGAASLATLLNEFYGQNVSEAQVLRAMDQGDGMASFEDMARALPQFGFRAQGFAASWEQLERLRMPVIVYVQHRRQSHFTVLRGVGPDSVWLADPSLGNRTYSRAQFLALWRTRSQAPELGGKFLAVLPLQPELQARSDFFTRAPQRQTSNALKQLQFRTFAGP